MTVRVFPPILAVLAMLIASCNKAEVSSYRVPKEKDPEMPSAAGAPAADAPTPDNMASTAVPTAEGAELTWTAPAEWKSKPGSAMRKGSYAVPGVGGSAADLSITAFPGDVGGELANVNRWRGQVQLQPIGEADLATVVQRVAANGLAFGVVDFASAGANPQRILGAYVSFGGATWFFKLAGPDTTVATAKPAFLAFLQTVKPATATTR